MNYTCYRTLFFALLLSSFHSYGAIITTAQTPSGRPLGGITIEGPIEIGDFDRFVTQIFQSNQKGGPGPVYLASPGGNFVEAMRIGHLIRELKLTVFAPEVKDHPWSRLKRLENNLCASSCFFIYAAGVQRFGKILGVHRPYLSKKDYEDLTLDAAANTHSNIQDISSAYLRTMGVPSSISEKIMAVSSEQIKWLTNAEVDELYGLISEYQEWFKARCAPKELILEPWKTEAKEKCVYELLQEEQERVFQDYWRKATIKKYGK